MIQRSYSTTITQINSSTITQKTTSMTSHEIDYKIIGEDIQVVEIELDPNETVIAEAGAMLYMEDGIQFETKMGDGSEANQSLSLIHI